MTTTNLSDIRQRQPRLGKTVLSLAVATVFTAAVVPAAHAAGLGRLTVQSALGQPLKAQVEITSLSEGEASSLTAKLASSNAFRQAGLEFNPALTSLRFKINRTSNGRALVEISSTRPINEPFVDLLVELNWATGKFVREYTFLLDPPELRLGKDETVAGGQQLVTTPAPSVQQPVAAAQPQPVQVAPPPAPAPVAASPAAPAESATTLPPIAKTVPLSEESNATAPAVVADPQPASSSRVASPAPAVTATEPASSSRVVSGGDLPSSVQVARGDTLGNIARALPLQGATLDQAIVAIYRANPDAFFGSVHQLRAGKTLVVPSAAEIAAVSQSEVRSEMRASNKTWREYRARLASASQASPTISETAPSGSAAVGQIATEPTDTGPATSEGDQLKLSREGAGSDSTASATGTTSEENTFARDAALQDAQSRVTELERNVKDLQRLLELKNKQLADLSDQVATAETAAATVAASTESAGASDAAASTESASTGTTDATASTESAADSTESAATDTAATESTATDTETATTAAPAADATDGTTTETAESTESATTESTALDPVAAANEAAEQAADATGSAVTAVTETAQTAASDAADAANEAGGGIMNRITSLASNPMAAGAGAGVLGLLAALFFWRRRKSKQDEADFEDTLAAGGDDAFAANSLFGTTGGQDVDTSASNSLFNTANGSGTTVGDETSVDVHSTEVDPIAEAEVYIAYGREAQAEEILKEALKRQPERQAIRLKLLEIYAGRKDAGAYGAVAREMYDVTNGQNEEWPKVITMGLSIDPTNPLYTGEGEDLTDPATVSGQSTIDDPDTQSGGIGGGVAAAAAGVAGGAGASALVDALSSPTEMVDTSPETQIADVAPATETADELSSLDFDLDISTEMDTSPDTIMPDTEVVTSTSDQALGEALNDNIDMPSLDMDTATVKPETVADLSPDTSVDTIATTDTEAAGDVDLSAIGLDLEPSGGAAPAGSDPARWQEMATKLDLASAYEEIGDKEGARELLDEVIKGGDDSQQQKAQTMLAKLS